MRRKILYGAGLTLGAVCSGGGVWLWHAHDMKDAQNARAHQVRRAAIDIYKPRAGGWFLSDAHDPTANSRKP